MPYPAGTVVQNRYRIVKLIGQGGFGEVYKAWDIANNSPCALKRNLDTTPEALRQFQREANILKSINHPNLVKVHEYFFDSGSRRQYLIMEFIEGENMEDICIPNPVSVGLAIDSILQILSGIINIHSFSPPIIHRDIKPANIRVRPNGDAVLVDFGIARFYDPKQKTTKGARAATDGYSPPEQYGGGTDPRSDIYALGATIYTFLTGIVPQPSTQRWIKDNVVSVKLLNKNAPDDVSNVIDVAMRLHPEARYQTATELNLALIKCMNKSAQAVKVKQQYQTTPQQFMDQPAFNNRIFVICPRCNNEFLANPGKAECPSCKSIIVSDNQGIVIKHTDISVECPNCYHAYKAKYSGKAECPQCKWKFEVGRDGSVLSGEPIKVRCPNCQYENVIQETGIVICSACKWQFSIDNFGKINT